MGGDFLAELRQAIAVQLLLILEIVPHFRYHKQHLIYATFNKTKIGSPTLWQEGIPHPHEARNLFQVAVRIKASRVLALG